MLFLKKYIQAAEIWNGFVKANPGLNHSAYYLDRDLNIRSYYVSSQQKQSFFNMAGFGQMLIQTQSTTQRVTQKQKVSLKLLLSQRQILIDSVFPKPEKGLDGMRVADGLLKEKKSIGILIGGLAESIWISKTDPRSLAMHKDVDVLVIAKEDEGIEPYEAGIDWWQERTEKLEIKDEISTATNVETRWWQNGAKNCYLRFGIDKNSKVFEGMSPGLYIPSCDWVLEMRYIEAMARLDYRRVELDFPEDVEECFKNKLAKQLALRDTLIPEVKADFGGSIFEIEKVLLGVDLRIQLAINKFLYQSSDAG